MSSRGMGYAFRAPSKNNCLLLPRITNLFPMSSFLNCTLPFRIVPASMLIALISCNSPKQEESTAMEGDSVAMVAQDTSANGSAKKMLRSIPSPLQVASMFRKAGIRYRADVLNPPSNVSGYTTNYSKAVNLGVYVADLAYSELNDQTQTAVTYFKACKTLADELEVSDVFESSGMQSRFQNNINNKDSILLIVADMNRDLINFFRENGREVSRSHSSDDVPRKRKGAKG